MNKFAFLVIALMTFVSFVAAQNVGINTTNPLARLHVDLGTSMSNGILFTGGEPAGGTFPSLGAGYRLMYYPARGVFRAGYVDDTQWDNSNVGTFSFGFGFNPIAKGNGSFAAGDGTYAGGTISTAFGNTTITKGYSSFVLGMYNDPLIIGADQDFALPSTPLFIVGNGDGNGPGQRSNAMIVRKDGHVGIGTNTPANQLSVSGNVDISENVGISGTVVIGNTTPSPSAQLEVSSTTKGFLPPRMSSFDKISLAYPEPGLIIWCNDCGIKGQLQIYNGDTWTNMSGEPALGFPTVGSRDGGGVIAYIFQPGDPGYIAGEFHGLIASSEDLSEEKTWSCEVDVPGASGTALGTGYQNTIDIITTCNLPGIVPAAHRCGYFVSGGYADWYLPSKDELNILVLNDYTIGGFALDSYWTSSEISGSLAWSYNFLTSAYEQTSKTASNHVRAIRNF